MSFAIAAHPPAFFLDFSEEEDSRESSPIQVLNPWSDSVTILLKFGHWRYADAADSVWLGRFPALELGDSQFGVVEDSGVGVVEMGY